MILFLLSGDVFDKSGDFSFPTKNCQEKFDPNFFFFLETGVGFCLNILPKDKRISRDGGGSPLIQDPPDGVE